MHSRYHPIFSMPTQTGICHMTVITTFSRGLPVWLLPHVYITTILTAACQMSISPEPILVLATRFTTMTSLSTTTSNRGCQGPFSLITHSSMTLHSPSGEAISQSTTAMNHSQRHISIQEALLLHGTPQPLWPGHFATS